MNDLPETPSMRRLLITVSATLLLAAVILVVIVLPAEYQIDPTGIGQALGLGSLSAAPVPETEPMAAASSGVSTAYQSPYRSESVTVEIDANEEIELKVAMGEGATMLFNWAIDRGS